MQFGAHFARPPERGEKARGREGVVAGARDHADADAVGFELLKPGIAGDGPRGGGLDLVALLAAFDDLGSLRDHRLRLFLLSPQESVARGDMGDFVRHHGGDLGGVIGQGEQAPGHEKIARGQREGVDHRRIQDGDAIGLGWRVARGRQPNQDLIEVGLGLGPLIFAAIKRGQPFALGVLRRVANRLGRGGGRRRRRWGHALLFEGRAARQQRQDGQPRQGGSHARGEKPSRACALAFRHRSAVPSRALAGAKLRIVPLRANRLFPTRQPAAPPP